MPPRDTIPRVPGFKEPRIDLLTGGQPDEGDWLRLRRAGVTTVVNLRTAEEMAGRDAAGEAQAAGLRYLSMPIDGAAGVTPEAARALWALLESETDGGATLVHCASGNRVGALLAVGAAQSGAMSTEQAIEFGRAAGLTGLEDRVRELLAPAGTR
ncbi:sulfur transferase domain-containing protein [Luteimonas pelagia]